MVAAAAGGPDFIRATREIGLVKNDPAWDRPNYPFTHIPDAEGYRTSWIDHSFKTPNMQADLRHTWEHAIGDHCMSHLKINSCLAYDTRAKRKYKPNCWQDVYPALLGVAEIDVGVRNKWDPDFENRPYLVHGMRGSGYGDAEPLRQRICVVPRPEANYESFEEHVNLWSGVVNMTQTKTTSSTQRACAESLWVKDIRMKLRCCLCPENVGDYN